MTGSPTTRSGIEHAQEGDEHIEVVVAEALPGKRRNELRFLYRNVNYSSVEIDDLISSMLSVVWLKREIAFQRDRLAHRLVPSNALASVQSLIAMLEKREGFVSDLIENWIKSDLVSPETVHDIPVPREPTTPAGAAGLPRPQSALPAPQDGHELPRPLTSEHQRIVGSLGHYAQISGDVAAVAVVQTRSAAGYAGLLNGRIRPWTSWSA